MKNSSAKKFVLVVDSDSHIHSLFKVLCQQIPASIELVFSDHLNQAKDLLNNRDFHAVIADETVVSRDQWDFSIPVLWMGDRYDESADYIQKPLSIKDAKSKLERLLYHFGNIEIIGTSIQELLDQMEKISVYNTPVLLTGESGTGKELFARFIHQKSSRSLHNFTTVHCGAISENLMESEFFGHKKGSFTGAVADKKGFFEVSHQGTLFLDELGDLPLNLQAKLLRVVQDKKVRPIGSLEEYEVDVRIISATNQNLEQMIQKQMFREDLFHRLAIIHLDLPPLRERREDIPFLIQYFLKKNQEKYSKSHVKFSEEAFKYLQEYTYPGNIRELANMIEKAVLFSTGDVIETRDLQLKEHKTEDNNILHFEFPSEGMDLTHVMRQAEKQILSEAIHRSKGNREKAAQLLKITPRSLKHRIHKYKLA
ncbi:MAG: sigma-54 dependent transcriptional regulator [Bdellovibrionales bacterium]|nr:sigma-54 dependent transcriptional regulator [Bdellovibrionales bacterium]